jgi:hypothetical protein
MESLLTSPGTMSKTNHRLSPESAVMTSQRCTQVCCSPPPVVCTSASCSSCPLSSKSSCPANLPNYGLPQQYYGGAFANYYPHQYDYYYSPNSAYTTVPPAYQGSSIWVPSAACPHIPPVAIVEPVTKPADAYQWTV